MILAHIFLAPYVLPVPFWMYLYGCAATLVLSFALLAWLATAAASGADASGGRPVLERAGQRRVFRAVLTLLRIGALAALLLTIAVGFWGPVDPGQNVGMTIFWVWFLLAFVYLTAVGGDLYRWINPWNTLGAFVTWAGVDVDRPMARYPAFLAYWPALVMYVALVWMELFALPRPATLATALSLYTVLTMAGMTVFGRADWLWYGDVFGVLFRVAGSLAPVDYAPGADGAPRILLRPPLSGTLKATAEHVSLIAFILFMLASTTYDTVHGTYLWVSLYWQRLLPLLRPLWGGDVIAMQSVLTTGYWWYQWLGLILSPALYLALFFAVLWAARSLARAPGSTHELAGRFAYSLVPIAIAYHATHYAPAMLTQLPSLLPQLADPFLRGWHLVPFATGPVAPLPMSVIWHGQVFVLLAGHVAAVYVAHVVALRVFPSHRQGVASQVPMLVLMIAYTCLGLWALSLPLGVPQILLTPG